MRALWGYNERVDTYGLSKNVPPNPPTPPPLNPPKLAKGDAAEEEGNDKSFPV